MTGRAKQILRNVAIGFGALLLIAAAVTLLVINTHWFRNYVREKIIGSTEEATGGRVDIRSFEFDVSHLRAVVNDFVIHGRESASAPPFLSAARVQLDIRLFTSIHHLLDVAYLGIQSPRANIFSMPDGNSNAPVPKQTSASAPSPLQTVVDLAVGHFELTNGMATYDSRPVPLNVRANNVHAQLYYNIVNQGYQGQLELEPLYVVAGRNTPVACRLILPMALQKDRIDFHDAKITTPLSSILLNGSMENMNNPKFSAHLNGYIAPADLQNAAGLPFALNAHNVPSRMDIDATASVSSDAIDVRGLRASFGHSNIEGSGSLKNPRGNASFQFRTQLVLGELGRLAKVPQRPEGTLVLNGAASFDAANNYKADGNVDARDISFQQGPQRFSNINVLSAVHVDPHNIDLEGMRLNALGGEFLGNALLKDFAQYKLQGSLRNLDIQSAASAAGQKIPYDGILSGPVDVQGNIRAPGMKSIAGNAHLTITPGRRGILMSGRLDVEYNGASDNVAVQNSYLALPHSRLTLNGSVSKQINVAFTSTDLNDLVAAASSKGAPPVSLNQGGEADFTGTVGGSLGEPRIAGRLAFRNFSVEGRAFTTAAADLTASANSAAAHNGVLTRAAMRAQFDASVGLHKWSAPPSSPLTANLTLTNGDVADVVALGGFKSDGYSGVLTVSAHIGGTLGDPQGSAHIQAANGTLEGQPFDQMQAQVNLADQLVTIPAVNLQSGAGRISLTGEFRHPRDSFATGRIHFNLRSNQIDLGQIRNVQSRQPSSAGTLQLNADVSGILTSAEFLLTSVNVDASARALNVEGQTYGDFTAAARTSGQTVTYNATSDFAGSNLHVKGITQLVHNYPTTADADISNLPVERMLTLARITGIPARGILSGAAHVTGTMADPQGSADVELARAVVYSEPLDRVHVRVDYLAQTINVSQLEIVAGPSRIDLTGRYDHPLNNLQQGTARFHLASSHIDLARIHNVQSFRPGLGGTLDLNADGTAEVHEKDPRILLGTLNANLSANAITAQGRGYGDLKLTANTSSRDSLNFALDSNLTGAAIHGAGNAKLTANYPVNAQLTFTNVVWTRVQSLLGLNAGADPAFEAVTDGQVMVTGPLLKTDQLNGAIELTRLNLSTLPRPAGGKVVALVNQGPIAASLDHGTVSIRSVHLTGPQTDIQATGTASLTAGTLNVNLSANADLSLLQSVDRDIYSSGKIAVATAVRGTTSQPLLNGQMTLQAASFNYAPVPFGISNANGIISFNGNNARVQSLSAESGGGVVNLSGFVGFTDAIRFGLRADVTNVRLRVQQGVSITADADIRMTGTSNSSVVSGNAVVQQITYAPQSDIGSLLSRAAPPVQSPTAPSPLLDNMRLDIRVRTAPGMSVQAAQAQNLQADADLRIRGTASEPGVLGRVTVNEGQLVFFGSQYTVDTGTIAFYNPVRIEPVLDISLETLAKGVTVTLRVTGPIDNMKLSYTSDPPLQFQEIVTLLASGRTPTSDPTLLANQPQQPAQSYQQMGESAIVGKALADPVASRLERVFGVTQLKIDPSFTTGSDVPTARLTLQQRITNNLTFTYVSAIDDPNSTIIRIEFAINPQFSAVATRDQNGIFSVNFFYKKQFR